MFVLEGLSRWLVLAEIEIGQVSHLDSMVCLLESLTLVYREPTMFGRRLLSVAQGSNGEHGLGDRTHECCWRIAGTVLGQCPTCSCVVLSPVSKFVALRVFAD
jgi:hypothetical protein